MFFNKFVCTLEEKQQDMWDFFLIGNDLAWILKSLPSNKRAHKVCAWIDIS